MANGVGRLVLDVDAAVIPISILIGRFAFLSSCRTLGRERSNVETLPKEVNGFQERQALDQPANPVMHGKPGFVRGRMSVTAPPASDRLFEARRKAAVATTALAAAPFATTALVAASVSLRGARLPPGWVIPR